MAGRTTLSSFTSLTRHKRLMISNAMLAHPGEHAVGPHMGPGGVQDNPVGGICSAGGRWLAEALPGHSTCNIAKWLAVEGKGHYHNCGASPPILWRQRRAHMVSNTPQGPRARLHSLDKIGHVAVDRMAWSTGECPLLKLHAKTALSDAPAAAGTERVTAKDVFDAKENACVIKILAIPFLRARDFPCEIGSAASK